MSGRETVRALRDSGAFDTRPGAPRWMGTAIFGVAMLAMAACAYFGVTFFVGQYARPSVSELATLPGGGPSFANIGKALSPAAQAQASAATTPRKYPRISNSEQNSCDDVGSKAYLAYAQGPGHSHDVHDFDTPAGVVVMTSNVLACMAATRPPHLCNPEDAFTFTGAAVSIILNYHAVMTSLTALSDADLATLRAQTPSLGKIPMNALKADIADIEKAMETAHARTVAAFARAVKSGYLRMETALPGPYELDSGALNELLSAAPQVPNACAA